MKIEKCYECRSEHDLVGSTGLCWECLCDYLRECNCCGEQFVGSKDGTTRTCSQCEDLENEDPLAGDVDRCVPPQRQVSYPGPNGPEYEWVDDTELMHTCYNCGIEMNPEEGNLCAECQEELGT